MFTGIIKGKFPVVILEDEPGLRSFEVELSPELCEGIKLGMSISVDGVCLTVVKINNTSVRFEVMEETLRKTTLGDLKLGDFVNIERSAKMGDEIGGHIISGHVSTVAEIIDVHESENNKAMTFKVDSTWMKYFFSKGFIGLDGASLTVVDAKKDGGTFQVWFIPETLRLTRFGEKKVGDKVNVEIDSMTQTIVETVERVMES
ncbi:riboflavin synthase subunit alpha [Candidatus Falkowbacteria bacterium]|nr:riboflavin synthase subunit alpha [Candidatus Falkowbacteria bacterium]